MEANSTLPDIEALDKKDVRMFRRDYETLDQDTRDEFDQTSVN